jgi:1,4-dihydroxy-2-naphthoate octaprenyltransferase
MIKKYIKYDIIKLIIIAIFMVILILAVKHDVYIMRFRIRHISVLLATLCGSYTSWVLRDLIDNIKQLRFDKKNAKYQELKEIRH